MHQESSTPPDSIQSNNVVTAQLSIPEHIFVDIAKFSDTPTEFLNDFIIQAYNDGTLLSSAGNRLGVTSTTYLFTTKTSPDGRLSLVEKQPPAPFKKQEWTESSMTSFIDYLTEAMDHRSDIDILLSLLAAYAELGIARPSTTELRQARGLEMISGDAWNQELRTSKSRLRITAKHTGIETTMFGSPYGKGVKRIHPINIECLKALLQWKDRGIVEVTDNDSTGLVAANRFEEILKLPSPYHVIGPTP